MWIKAGLPLLVVLALSGCDLAPDYQAPSPPPVATYKETGPWVQATLQTALPREAWWTLYGDTTLNGLEDRIATDNPTLAQAQARYDAAQGYLEQAQSSILPSIGIGGHASTDKQSANRPLRSANQPTYYGDNAVAASVGWDLDLWGRIRNEVKAGKAQAQASYADMEGVKLSLQAQLADDYMSLRELDAQAALLRDAIGIYQKALNLTNYRHDKGIASGLDVGRAQAQFSDAQAQLADVLGRRALMEHAIASLVGDPASTFAVAPQMVALKVPNIPTDMPAMLLQRRPDVAAAERMVAATNAGIGVARAAFFPDISLSALGGFMNTGSDGLFAAPDAYWAVGPGMALTLFDNGRHEGQLAVARAANASAAAAYRATVLKAFQDVEDNRALLNRLAEAADAKARSVAAATKTQDLAMALYRNGALGFLDVVVAQTTALTAQQAQLTLQTRRLQASVGLIKAIGGGWSARELPGMAENMGRRPA
ncbi:MAG TPA: efflux transporter outer membrane subunit [Rhizomicrobium sp.]|nr:efflux transporter outer membrane subunit [Rhizomicrobium sp.]